LKGYFDLIVEKDIRASAGRLPGAHRQKSAREISTIAALATTSY
jgi:hypothetical protein